VKKWVLVVFAEEKDEATVNSMFDKVYPLLRDLKTHGQLKNTWLSEYESSLQEWERETCQQAHEIAMMEIFGQKPECIELDKLSDETKRRLKEAKDRIFRAMLP